jgi:protein SCO1/2
MFTHSALTLLVNSNGYVERAYRTKSPDQEEVIADLRTVREA